jgi:hypothetical protein
LFLERIAICETECDRLYNRITQTNIAYLQHRSKAHPMLLCISSDNGDTSVLTTGGNTFVNSNTTLREYWTVIQDDVKMAKKENVRFDRVRSIFFYLESLFHSFSIG